MAPCLLKAIVLAGLASVSAAATCVTSESPTTYAVVEDATSTTCTGQWILEAGQESAIGSSPMRKTHWTKRLAADDQSLHFGGRPDRRGFQYLYEQGFSAVYSLYHDDADIAAEAGLFYHQQTSTAHSEAGNDELTAFIDFIKSVDADAVIYVHCGCGFHAGAALEIYKAGKGIHTTSAAAITEFGNHGFDMQEITEAITTLNTLTGDSTTATVDSAGKATMCSGGRNWWLKYLGKFGTTTLFDAGQIESTMLADLADTSTGNIRAIINMRKNAEMGIETANLLNQKKDGSCDERSNSSNPIFEVGGGQRTEDTRPTSWISDTTGSATDINFETTNALEFGDAAGYNQATEAAAWANLSDAPDYQNLPVGSDYSSDVFFGYSDEMINAINTATNAGGHVLFHCRTGYRTGAFPSALIGVIQGVSSDDIAVRLAALGYDDSSKMAIGTDNIDLFEFNGTVTAGGIIEGHLVAVSTTTDEDEDTDDSSEDNDDSSVSSAVAAAPAAMLLAAALLA